MHFHDIYQTEYSKQKGINVKEQYTAYVLFSVYSCLVPGPVSTGVRQNDQNFTVGFIYNSSLNAISRPKCIF